MTNHYIKTCSMLIIIWEIHQTIMRYQFTPVRMVIIWDHCFGAVSKAATYNSGIPYQHNRSRPSWSASILSPC